MSSSAGDMLLQAVVTAFQTPVCYNSYLKVPYISRASLGSIVTAKPKCCLGAAVPPVPPSVGVWSVNKPQQHFWKQMVLGSEKTFPPNLLTQDASRQ